MGSSRDLRSDLVLWGGIAAGLVMVRGLLVARSAGGVYPFDEALCDAGCLAAIVAVARLVDRAIARLGHPTTGASRWRRWSLACARLTFVGVVVAPLLMALAQFCPQRIRSAATPSALGMRYESAVIPGDGPTLAAWDIPTEQADAPIVLIAYGLGVNKSGFLHVARLMHDQGYHVVMFDFRGHGESSGRATTFGFQEADDVVRVREWTMFRLR